MKGGLGRYRGRLISTGGTHVHGGLRPERKRREALSYVIFTLSPCSQSPAYVRTPLRESLLLLLPFSAAPISIPTHSLYLLPILSSSVLRSRIGISNNSLAHPFVYSAITIIDRYDVHYTESIILVGIIDSWKFRRRYLPLLLDISFGCLNIGEFRPG